MKTVKANNLESFAEWLNGGSTAPAVYFEGLLSKELTEVDSPKKGVMPADSVMSLATLRKAVRVAEREGRVLLVQRRVRPMVCEYIAIKTDAQKNRATIDARIAA